MAKPVFQVYNTITKQKEVFEPKVPGKVGMYICGVTAYNYSHLGHARAYVAFDVLYRYLKHLDYDVNYVRNFTDVDDKCFPPSHQPRVSDHMDQIRDMIAQIIRNECAYIVGGNVYFSVDKFPEYGRLSGRKLEDNRAGERVAVDSRKRNPADFALWKAAKDGEPRWDSPWGPGRPGWHIECSAMSAHYLSFSFDSHGGGMDLIFPHHGNEYAQSCAACSETNIRYWMHNGFVTINNEKMSKSLGNFFTIREITKQYHPLALRYFLNEHTLSVSHQLLFITARSCLGFHFLHLSATAKTSYLRFLNKESLKEGKNSKGEKVTSDAQECIKKLSDDFQARMSDDLHTRDILNGALQETLRFMNKSLDSLKKKKQKQPSMFHSLSALEREVKKVLEIVGLLSEASYSEVLQQLKDKALKRAGLTEEDVTWLIEERVQARLNKEYAKSDQIRLDLKTKGVALMDLGKETIWRPCLPEFEKEKESISTSGVPNLEKEKDTISTPASTPNLGQENETALKSSVPVKQENPITPADPVAT